VKTRYLFAAFLLCAAITVFALRANYSGMVELRNAVYEADERGEGVEEALQELRAYVGSHMNTNLDTGDGIYPPIQLKHTYQRLVQAEQERVSNANSSIYSEAQRHCETVDPNSVLGRERLPCIEEYIKSNSSQTARAIPDALYKFDFVSPRWSPDLAGWSLLLGGLLLAAAGLRYALGKILPYITR
jgi:hypothetical protein